VSVISVPEKSEQPLPEVQVADLDGATFEAYFADLEECADVRSITLKSGPETRAEEPQVSLEQAHLLLIVGSIRGAQIRYLFDGVAWIDTLVAQGESVRLVRVADPVQPVDVRTRRRLPILRA
jgi:hypothetical protein